MSKRERWWVAVVMVCAAAVVLASGALQAGTSGSGPRVDIWTDRGAGGVYRAGDPAEIHMRPAQDCYVIVYEIDTDGYLRLLFPGDCRDDGYVVGGRTYIVAGGPFSNYYVGGPAGVEYVHVLASYEPFRQLYWHGCDGYSAYAQEATWGGFQDYWGSALPPRVYGDPYMAMQTIDEFICLDALESGLVWADFTYFYVGGHVRYPRYLCYDCHGFDTRFEPYADACIGFSFSFVDYDRAYAPWSWWWWVGGAYRGPRFVCHSLGHHVCDSDCDHHDGRGHRRDDHGGPWPSEYKWKSRSDTFGQIVREMPESVKSKPAVVKNEDIGRGDRGRDVRVTSKVRTERQSEGKSEKQSERQSGRQTVTMRPSGTERTKADSKNVTDALREIARIARVDHKTDRKVGNNVDAVRVKPTEERAEREATHATRNSDGSKVRNDSGSTSRSENSHREAVQTRERSTRTESGTKSRSESTPQVRRGNQGKSPSARRSLSR